VLKLNLKLDELKRIKWISSDTLYCAILRLHVNKKNSHQRIPVYSGYNECMYNYNIDEGITNSISLYDAKTNQIVQLMFILL
jgi:hypothetical protein